MDAVLDVRRGTNSRPRSPGSRVRRGVTAAVGVLYLLTAGVHVGIVSSDTEVYRRFADHALVPGVRNAWADVFMADPHVWGLAVAAGELLIGVAVLADGPWTRIGLVGAIGFTIALMVFGWWAWAWSVPMLVVLTALLHNRSADGAHTGTT